MLSDTESVPDPSVSLRILMVEDDLGFAEFLRDALEPLAPNLQLKEVRRLSTALSAIRTSPFDAILLDLNLPDSDGLRTLTQVTSAAADLPVVVLTGIADARQAHDALRLGAQDWLTKDSPDPHLVLRALRYAVERKRLTNSVTRLQKLEAVGRLAANVAHEFNNVLMAIMASAERAAIEEDASLRSGALRDVQHAANRGALLTRQLLGLTRPRVTSQTEADVNTVVANVQGLLHAVLPRQIRVRLELGQGVRVSLAPEHLEQILLNLLLNARDAMPAGGTVTVAVMRTNSHVRIEVSDTGTGIQPEALRHIFEPFFTTKGAAGTGLGLAITKELVEQAGGHIRAESTAGAGTSMIVQLPTCGDGPMTH